GGEGSTIAARNTESVVRGETRFDQEGRLGRDVGEDSRSKSKAKKKAIRFGCGKTCHFKRDYTNSEKNSEGSSKSINVIQNDSFESGDSDMFSITSDSHMTPHREWFETYKAGNLNDKTCGIVGIRQIKVHMHDGIIRMLTEVHHIPTLKKNLISFGTLHVNGFDYKSNSDCVKVGKGAMTVMKGQITTGRVYQLTRCIIIGGAAAAVSESDNTALWHLRTGHIREHSMTELHKRGLLVGLKSCKMRICKFCIMGK
ncbi:hypothetical protein V2J09_021094, partial [Rumex salicifolius]